MIEPIVFNLAKEMAKKWQEELMLMTVDEKLERMPEKKEKLRCPKNDQGMFEDKSAGVGKKAEVEKKESEWKEMVEQIFINLAKELAERASDGGQKYGRNADERRKEGRRRFASKDYQGKFIAQLLDFSRNGAKAQEMEEQQFPDCNWKTEELERKRRQKGKMIRTE